MQNLKFIIIALCVSLTYSYIVDIESEKIQYKWRTMVLAIHSILNDFVSEQSNSLFVCTQTKSVDSQSYDQSKPNELLDELLQVLNNEPKVTLFINVNDLKHPTFENNSLWIVDGFESFWKIFNKTTDADFDSSRYFVIALTIMEENPYDTVNRILVECWKYHVANLVILVPSHSYNRILLYTYFPYTDDHCEQIKPIVRNIFENNSFFDTSLSPFPDKCGNFHQCTLYVAATNDEPYTFLTGYGTNETPQFSGLDAMVVGEIARRLNFKMEVLPYDGGFYYDDQYYKVNISVAGANPLRKYNRRDTIPYIYDTKLYVIPPGKRYSSLAKLLFPFKVEVWIGICSTFLLMVALILTLKFMSKKKSDFVIGCNNNAPLLNLFSLILGGSITTRQLPQGSFARTILVILLVATLILRNAYVGNVFNFLRTQRRMEPLYYIRDIYDSDVAIYANPSRSVQFDSPDLQKRKRSKELNLDEIRGDNLDGVYCQLKNIVDYNNFMNFRKPKLLMTRDYISMYMILMKVRESTCLKIAIDRQIAALQSSGLVEHWQKSYTKTVKDTEDKNPINLKLDQFTGIIEICAALYALSLLMFLMELMSSKCKIIRIFMDILTFK